MHVSVELRQDSVQLQLPRVKRVVVQTRRRLSYGSEQRIGLLPPLMDLCLRLSQ